MVVMSSFDETASPDETASAESQRIISVAPSLTETLFALGLGDRVVGVSRYCNYPPEAQDLPRIGGFLDPNPEAILALKPDTIVLFPEHDPTRLATAALDIRHIVVPHQTLDDILGGFTLLGKELHAEVEAQRIVDDLHARIQRVEQQTADKRRPRVLLCVNRTLGSGKLQDVMVAASDGYYDRLIELAGGENACRQAGVAFPAVSSEGILWMKPEVIVDIVPPDTLTKLDVDKVRADWRHVADTPAVRDDRVVVIDADYASIPGPRFILLLEKLAEVLHPETYTVPNSSPGTD